MPLKDGFYYTAGIGFLALAKAKHVLQGYASPKPFDLSDTERCIDYDIEVAEQWLSRLAEYRPQPDPLRGKEVLELGPGSDLGIGIYLLAKGCSRYNACDVNDLTTAAPDAFYRALFERIRRTIPDADTAALSEQLRRTRNGTPSRLNYAVREDFDIVAAFGRGSVDLVFSQAAFEHFDDIDATIAQLTAVCRPGAALVVEIDLKTHSRWIRDKDPNNIYRYPPWLYHSFHFRGSPNRKRPMDYLAAFERHGWTDIEITAVETVSAPGSGRSGMYRAFTDERNQMDYLSVILCARKPEMA